ncbi:two-component regulator propeller domain-containing protein [uncultured Maribacter sp.]|uniref:hybrid sensor histidine kinase/response regulator transcription factor n=1 Tax=uncultured Maribacter sp. TaxID=431308 RepID=UPI00261C5FA7|nr:two-component regulator propeller domain-containing protein [uncultured Maribacter sp.]
MRHSLYLLTSFLLCNILSGQNNIYFDHLSTKDGLSQNDINDIYQDEEGFMWFATHDGLNKYDGYTFTNYVPQSNTKGSISSNLVYSITGDKDGNLWIGTTGGGLNFFDRKTEKFIHFKHEKNNPNSIDSNSISDVYIDKKERLWISSNKGVSMLDLKKPIKNPVFQKFNPVKEPSISGWDGSSVLCLFEDNNGQIWTGGINGIYKLTNDKNNNLFFRLENETIGIPAVGVRSIKEDKFGRLIISTNMGLYCHGGKNDSVSGAKKISDGSYTSIQIDNYNNIWVGSNSGLLYFSSNNGSNYPEATETFTYNPEIPNSLSKDIIKSLYIDKTGIIWVGTNGGGINKIDLERKQFRHIRKTLSNSSLSYDKIRAIFEDSNKNLWLGTEGGGLNMLTHTDNDNYTHFKKFDISDKIFSLEEIQEGDKKMLLIGAEGIPSLYKLDITHPEKIKTENAIFIPEIKKSVFTIKKDRHNVVWIGTYSGGVYRSKYDSISKSYEIKRFSSNPLNKKSISSDIIRNIYEDSKGFLWFGTGDGLCRLNSKQTLKNKPKFKVYKNDPKDSTSISHNYILPILETSKGDIWIGTFGGGLNKFVRENKGAPEHFITYDTKHGLPNNVIKGILEDDEGHLWLSTNKGLSKFNPETEIFTNYDEIDGLQNYEFQELACLKRKNGEFLFGGVNGFNTFYPENIEVNEIPAETVITNFLISNKKIGPGELFNGRVILKKTINTTKTIELKYKENSFSFEFAALHYAAPSKNQFAYMLKGFDEDWIKTNSNKRFANYTNLEPGTYHLLVKASNNDGIWDVTPSEIEIKVIPPFWRTNWAYLLYTALILGLIWLFWRYTFIKTTEKHQLELEHLEKEQSEEMQRIKLEFFTNISHEFRTPLTLIKGPLEYLQKNGENVPQKAIQEQYTLMHKNTNYLLKLVSQLLDFRKINQGKMHLVVRQTNVVSFITELAEPFQFLAHKKMIDFVITSSPKEIQSWVDHDALEKICNNLLSNAFKFTPENGKIEIKIFKEKNTSLKLKSNECIGIKVIDNGKGISKEKIENVFKRFYSNRDDTKLNAEGMGIGLSFTKNLIELHRGKISVTSQPGIGTEFTVHLPLNYEAYQNIEEISRKEVTDSDFLIRSSETESFAISINDEILDKNLSNSRSKLPILLVVDDNKDIRLFIKQALSDKFTIYEAENGEQGLDYALKLMPNIILSDVVMPIMDGITLCKNIKEKEETSHIPVILLTAKSSEESKLKGLESGADDYLTKPFNLELLKVKLNNTIARRDVLRKRFNRNIKIQPKEITVTSVDENFLNQAIEIVEKHMMNSDFNVEMLVKEMGLSRSNLYLKFKELTGLSSSEFIRNIRLKRAVQLFEKSDLSVKEIMYMTGFNTASYFSKCFKKQFGVIPSEYVNSIKNNKASSS